MKKKLKVKIPPKTSQYKVGNNVYIYYVVEKKYDKNHKYNNNKRVSIGTKIDEDYMYANDNYYDYFEIEEEKKEAPLYSDTLKIGNTMLIKKIMDDLKVYENLELVYGNFTSLIADVASYFIISEGEAIQYFDSYAFDHPTITDKLLDDSLISELFKTMESKDLEEFISYWNQLYLNSEDIYISYDSTNINCSSSGIDMADFGHPKIDVGKPVLNVGIASKQSDGTPLFYESYEGSIVDVAECRYMVKRCKDYGYKNIGFILDRGYFSKENIDFFDKNNYEFIMMVKTNSKFLNSVFEEVKLKLKNDVSKYIPGHYVYGITKEMKLYSSDKKKRFVHYYYSDEKASSERIKLLESIQKERMNLDKHIEAKTHTAKDVTSYNKHFYLKFDNQGYLESYSEKKTEIQKQADRLGYFSIITSKKMSAEEALTKYRSRDFSEKLYMFFKSELGMNTLRVHSDISAKSKLFISFISLIVRNEMYQKFKELAKKEKDRKNYTVPSAIHILDKFFITKTNNKYSQLYALNKKQKLILKSFGIDDKYIDTYINNLNKSLTNKF